MLVCHLPSPMTGGGGGAHTFCKHFLTRRKHVSCMKWSSMAAWQKRVFFVQKELFASMEEVGGCGAGSLIFAGRAKDLLFTTSIFFGERNLDIGIDQGHYCPFSSSVCRTRAFGGRWGAEAEKSFVLFRRARYRLRSITSCPGIRWKPCSSTPFPFLSIDSCVPGSLVTPHTSNKDLGVGGAI